MPFKRITRRLRRALLNVWIGVSRRRIVVLGDSHCAVFKYINKHYRLKEYFDVLMVPGATAMGMVNPNSKTNCLKIFRDRLTRIRSSQPIIVLLGEVDTGFVIWYRAKSKGVSIESQFERSLENYCSFVKDVVEQGYESMCLMSAPLPTIKDNQSEFGEIADLRNEIDATLADRTKLTLRYNTRLREFCAMKNLRFLDLDEKLLGDSGTISDSFLNKDPMDHHCDHESYSKIILNELIRQGLVS